SHVGNPNDPVGPWYEAALPNREAFCIRDVSHQCIGNEILGQGKENFNMMEKFVMNISEGRDYCSYWEINRYNKPAPVDYTSNQDFWYNLNANFDLIDAAYKLYQWTGNKKYISSSAFDRFFQVTLNQYIDRWQLQHDKIMQRPAFMNLTETTLRFKEARGIPSYDESQDNMALGSDLLAIITNGFSTYAKILQHTGHLAEAKIYQEKAGKYKHLIDSLWWDNTTNTYYDFYKTDQKFYHGGTAKSEYLLWYQIMNDSSKISRSLRDLQNSQTEVLSYLPMIFYRYGLSAEAYDYLNKIYTDPRRMYPEASSGAMEGIVRGMMGIEPSASENIIATCPRFHTKDIQVKVENIPVFSGKISVNHVSSTKTIFKNSSNQMNANTAQSLKWRATFRGDFKQIKVNGKRFVAKHFLDPLHVTHSYIDIPLVSKSEITAEAI
ncbi:MAG: trehalase family glycosidase, partial [Chitinophagaceae bacterium]